MFIILLKNKKELLLYFTTELVKLTGYPDMVVQLLCDCAGNRTRFQEPGSRFRESVPEFGYNQFSENRFLEPDTRFSESVLTTVNSVPGTGNGSETMPKIDAWNRLFDSNFCQFFTALI